MEVTKKVFYVNLTILDASEAIRQQVEEKISEKQSKLPGPANCKEKVRKKIADIAATKVPPAKIAEKMSEKMLKLLPFKMKQKGITVVANRAFLEGPYFVLELQIQHVDAVLLAEAKDTSSTNTNEEEDDDDSIASAELDAMIEEQKKVDEAKAYQNKFPSASRADSYQEVNAVVTAPRTGLAGYVQWIWNILGMATKESIEKKHLPFLIQSKIAGGMAEMLKKKMDGKKIKAETAVLPEAEQARYFFANLKKVKSQS